MFTEKQCKFICNSFLNEMLTLGVFPSHKLISIYPQCKPQTLQFSYIQLCQQFPVENFC